MKEPKKSLPSLIEAKQWVLFLDRDGVINQPIIDDYARKPYDFLFTERCIEALELLSKSFGKLVLVTNQQGVGKGVMSEADLENVHLKLYRKLKENNIAYLDLALYAPYLKKNNHAWRKPNTGMASRALKTLNLEPNTPIIMIGDSPGDMALADKINAIKVRISTPQFTFDNQDYTFDSLWHFSQYLTQL